MRSRRGGGRNSALSTRYCSPHPSSLFFPPPQKEKRPGDTRSAGRRYSIQAIRPNCGRTSSGCGLIRGSSRAGRCCLDGLSRDHLLSKLASAQSNSVPTFCHSSGRFCWSRFARAGRPSMPGISGWNGTRVISLRAPNIMKRACGASQNRR